MKNWILGHMWRLPEYIPPTSHLTGLPGQVIRYNPLVRTTLLHDWRRTFTWDIHWTPAPIVLHDWRRTFTLGKDMGWVDFA